MKNTVGILLRTLVLMAGLTTQAAAVDWTRYTGQDSSTSNESESQAKKRACSKAYTNAVRQARDAVNSTTKIKKTYQCQHRWTDVSHKYVGSRLQTTYTVYVRRSIEFYDVPR